MPYHSLVVVCEGLGNVVYIRYNWVIDHEIEDGVLILPPVCYCIREFGIVVPSLSHRQNERCLHLLSKTLAYP